MDKSKTVSPSVAWAIIALAVLGFLALFYYVVVALIFQT
jgi:hypothetical protein